MIKENFKRQINFFAVEVFEALCLNIEFYLSTYFIYFILNLNLNILIMPFGNYKYF
jgi:hypothetical protein